MIRAAGFGCLALLLATTTAHARPARHGRRAHASQRSYFLAGDPHVPLAVVSGRRIDDRTITDRRCGSRARWKRLGSRWKALDAWGQPIGVYTAKAKDDYDVTGCAELSFSPALANDLTHVLVSQDSAWRPSASVAWSAPPAQRASLAALAKTSIDDSHVAKSLEYPQCASIPERTRFFHVPGRGDWAVATSNNGWLVARSDPRGWTVRSEDHSRTTSYSTGCFRPVAIFDMNGDGVPEIVMRYSGGDGWNDFVLALGQDDRWHVVASSNGGSTA